MAYFNKNKFNHIQTVEELEHIVQVNKEAKEQYCAEFNDPAFFVEDKFSLDNFKGQWAMVAEAEELAREEIKKRLANNGKPAFAW